MKFRYEGDSLVPDRNGTVDLRTVTGRPRVVGVKWVPVAELEVQAVAADSPLVKHLESTRSAAIVAADEIVRDSRAGELTNEERAEFGQYLEDAERASHQLDVLRRRRMQIRLFKNEPPASESSPSPAPGDSGHDE